MNDDVITPPAEVVEAVEKLEEFLDRTEIASPAMTAVKRNCRPVGGKRCMEWAGRLLV